jgi:hypothetical protein
MKRIALIAILAGALSLTASASASPLMNCGGYNMTNPAHGYWTYQSFYGYSLVWGLEARGVSCAYARPFSLHVAGYWSGVRNRDGFVCTNRLYYGEDWSVRCTRGSQIIQFAGGA